MGCHRGVRKEGTFLPLGQKAAAGGCPDSQPGSGCPGRLRAAALSAPAPGRRLRAAPAARATAGGRRGRGGLPREGKGCWRPRRPGRPAPRLLPGLARSPPPSGPPPRGPAPGGLAPSAPPPASTARSSAGGASRGPSALTASPSRVSGGRSAGQDPAGSPPAPPLRLRGGGAPRSRAGAGGGRRAPADGAARPAGLPPPPTPPQKKAIDRC